MPWYENATEEDRDRALADLKLAGVQQGQDTQRWLWNNRFSAVAADSLTWECTSGQSVIDGLLY